MVLGPKLRGVPLCAVPCARAVGVRVADSAVRRVLRERLQARFQDQGLRGQHPGPRWHDRPHGLPGAGPWRVCALVPQVYGLLRISMRACAQLAAYLQQAVSGKQYLRVKCLG